MTGFICFLSLDPSLGKVDKQYLSHQTLMELFIQGFSNKEIIVGDEVLATDIAEWNHVRLNDESEVDEINWGLLEITGSVELQWMPSTTTVLDFLFNNLTGTVDLTCLPDGLEYLNLGGNSFEGTIDLKNLPPRLDELSLFRNNFSGITDFSQLPKSLTRLDINDTNLEGEICSFNGILTIGNSNVKDMRKMKH